MAKKMLNKIIELLSKWLVIPLIMEWIKQFQEKRRLKKEHKEIDKQHARKHDEFKDNRTKDTFNNLP